MQSTRINAKKLITHRFGLDRIVEAYETFSTAAEMRALKTIIET
jgi:threonine dehydrogenase-like Zn-dependent dehydrogenase